MTWKWLVAILLLTLGLIFLAAGITANKTITSTNNEQNLNTNEENSVQGTKLENFEPKENVTELETIDIKVGEGEAVPAGATITAHYTGALAKDGTVFQSSKDFGRPIQFGLDGVIAGWTQGVPGMKVGGVRRLIIPAELAYGSTPPPGSGIPANAPLVFDIELVSID